MLVPFCSDQSVKACLYTNAYSKYNFITPVTISPVLQNADFKLYRRGVKVIAQIFHIYLSLVIKIV